MTTMVRVLWIPIACALLLASPALAGVATGEIVEVDDQSLTLKLEDGSTQRYEVSPDLRIVTPARHEITPRDLRVGQQIRIESAAAGKAEHPRARSIVVLKEPAAASQPTPPAARSKDGSGMHMGMDGKMHEEMGTEKGMEPHGGGMD